MRKCRILKNNNIIFSKAKILKGFFEKSIGLILRRELNENEALLFRFNKPRIYSFHMFFVFFPIDIIWLNEKMEIVEIYKNFKPFSIYSPKNIATNVLEMRKGSIAKHGLSLGDKLFISYRL
ncbi:MAG TPA: DUF192 domain-containing protein [Candidatus Woesearchaeota archaeon]|nr:DUF192 domain-containing protein [Candidatus Woesearchaeota archaeon]